MNFRLKNKEKRVKRFKGLKKYITDKKLTNERERERERVNRPKYPLRTLFIKDKFALSKPCKIISSPQNLFLKKALYHF